METTMITSCCFPLRNHQQIILPSHHLSIQSSLETETTRTKATASSQEGGHVDEETENFSGLLKRRSALVSGVSLVSTAVVGFPRDGLAVVKQGLLAGRIPGLSEPDEEG